MAADQFFTAEDARQMLRRAYRSDGEVNLKIILRRVASDPIKPISEKGRMRPTMLVAVGAIMLFLLMASFVYFSLGGQR